MPEAVLVSNGPGELYTWVRPTLHALRRLAPEMRVVISLVPCQFASGNEAEIARGFGADAVTTPTQFLRAAATKTPPGEFTGDGGFVLGLGGSSGMALRYARLLGYPAYRYSFVPYWNRRLRRLFVHDERARHKARLLGAPRSRVAVVGNLVADAVDLTEPAAAAGRPHILLLAGSRDGFAVHLIPFVIALADRLAPHLPGARFVWPVSRLLRPRTIEDGIAGVAAATLGGSAGQRVGDDIITPAGARLEMVPESERYAHMLAADLAVTIPGTNTLELGIAGVPAIVLLPLNRPEIIPLEGPGHWLSLLPLVGTSLKRRAVRLFVERLDYPVSLPNQLSGEQLMVEISGRVEPDSVAERARSLLADPDDLELRRRRLTATMPRAGAADRMLRTILEETRAA